MRSRPQPSAPRLRAPFGVGDGAGEVGEDFDALAAREVAVAACRGATSAVASCAPGARVAARTRRSSSRRRRDRAANRPRRRGALACPTRPQRARAERDEHRDAERAREDRDVRGGAARGERDAGEARRLDVDELRGREIAREQDASVRNARSRRLPCPRAPATPGVRDRADRRRARRVCESPVASSAEALARRPARHANPALLPESMRLRARHG